MPEELLSRAVPPCDTRRALQSSLPKNLSLIIHCGVSQGCIYRSIITGHFSTPDVREAEANGAILDGGPSKAGDHMDGISSSLDSETDWSEPGSKHPLRRRGRFSTIPGGLMLFQNATVEDNGPA